ncbi:PREDICTED: gamma-tubulin complex component 3-like [Acropora digitifera]|uniref:gamma-tubulin complex component 3-like n=1 Tax=Acropora digitifera TaxID=70779 RepID=UPI00077A870D|nr:PREDICTED: gamma-tubulin complex component 3-like [Acropora digitifera]
MASQEESFRSDSSSPEALLYKLCHRLLGKETDSKDKSIEISNHFQYAVKLLGSHFAPTVATDEFRVVERIKRKLLKEKGEVEIAIFAELYRKLVSQPVLKNRWAILYFLMSVGEDSSSKYSHGQVHVMCIKLIMIQTNSMIVNYFLSFFWIYYKKLMLVVNCSYIELRHYSGLPEMQNFFYFVIYLFFRKWSRWLIIFFPSSLGDKAMGLVGQSFCAALQQELTEYYRLLAVLEGQQQLGDAGFVGEGASGSLTLRRLMVWTFDPLTRLQTLAALVDACKGKKGGALLSALYSNMQHGDPFVKSLVRHILNLVSRPIRLILDRWIYEGELDDLYNEFFVAVDYDTKDDRLWYEKYSIRKPMLPSFISFELGTKILNIGKTINFIRRVCEDRSPIRGGEEKALDSIRSQEGSATAQLTAEEEFGGVALQETIDTAYRITSKRLLEIFFTKYKFVDHLRVKEFTLKLCY